MHVFNKFVHFITLGAAKAAQIALTFIMLIIVANVISRRLFGSPVPGTVELVEMSGAILLALAVAYTAQVKGHIMVSVLVERFSPRTQGLIDIVISSVSLFFTYILARETFVFAARMMGRGYSTGYLQLPVAPAIYLVGLGFAMLALVLLRDIVNAVMLVVKGSERV
ncbi:MAG: TRAP transporter small permease [Bacillota bacterium]|nr:TRAP transporter small permease [Bacillota bacterium]MDW7684503.1 TRAP transporter small permease [Bacillota bacterium]